MPGSDEPPGSEIDPFIFYTATYTSKRDEQFGLSLGASQFLAKPMEPELFVEAISKIVDEAPARRGTPAALEDESSYLRLHNERLVNKLSNKIAELQNARLNLEAELVEKEKEIARRKRAEEDLALAARQLGRANEDLLQFAYAAAHDLQEPLRNVGHVLGLLQLTNAGLLNEDAAVLIEDGVGAIRRTHTMVTDLLAFSRIGETAQTDRYSFVDTNAVVQEVLQNRAKACWR